MDKHLLNRRDFNRLGVAVASTLSRARRVSDRGDIPRPPRKRAQPVAASLTRLGTDHLDL
jgi:hypothetical protein